MILIWFWLCCAVFCPVFNLPFLSPPSPFSPLSFLFSPPAGMWGGGVLLAPPAADQTHLTQLIILPTKAWSSLHHSVSSRMLQSPCDLIWKLSSCPCWSYFCTAEIFVLTHVSPCSGTLVCLTASLVTSSYFFVPVGFCLASKLPAFTACAFAFFFLFLFLMPLLDRGGQCVE